MEELEKAGITGFVGKVNMDRNSAPGLLQETTEESRRETLRWLEACQDFPHIKPILTPRFIPSCTDGLMTFLGKLAQERGLPAQSHLSENRAEMDWVRRLHPDCAQYWEAYAKYGLWNERTLMAHCVWSDQRERAAMRDSGVTMVHCPDSNLNLCSGFPQVQVMLREGVKVALGSDVAGGDRLSMFDAVAGAVRSSKARRMVDGADFLTVPEAWYLGTSAGAAFRRSAAAAPPSESFRTAGTVRVPASARGHPGRVERRQEDLRGIGLPPPERRLSGAPCNQGPSYSGERGESQLALPSFTLGPRRFFAS